MLLGALTQLWAVFVVSALVSFSISLVVLLALVRRRAPHAPAAPAAHAPHPAAAAPLLPHSAGIQIYGEKTNC